jgi:hypothetical protein
VFGREKVQDFDHYLRDKSNRIEIGLRFESGDVARWTSSDKWPVFTNGHRQKRYHLISVMATSDPRQRDYLPYLRPFYRPRDRSIAGQTHVRTSCL